MIFSTGLAILGLLSACQKDGGKGGSDDDSGSVGPDVTDVDGDGIPALEDCNDGDPAMFPGATEVCNGLDDDCDGSIDDDLGATFYRDSDGDGYGDEQHPAGACAQPAGFVGNPDDCDDSNAAVNPDETEVCDLFEIDEDCSGQANEADPHVAGIPTWYEDHDEDGYGDDALEVQSCFDRPGLATLGSDCDDADYGVNPGTAELCDPDDKDEDCDGFSDVDDPEGPYGQPLYYVDVDDDDHGDSSDPGQYFCDGVPQGYVTDNTDCDDTNDIINMGAPEHCADGIDNDCNGGVDDCGPIPDINLEDANVRLESSESYGYHGWQVDDAGDVNDDGQADFATSGHSASGGLGKVWIFEGPIAEGTADPEDVAIATIEGDDIYGNFGISMSSAGDIDGDGYDDIVVGQGWPGAAYVFRGPFTGDSSTTGAEATWTEEVSGDSAGQQVAGGYDFDDDGLDDYLVGAPYATTDTYFYTGAAYVIYGPGTGTNSLADADAKIHGTTMYSSFAEGLSGVSDMDGDGADELVVGMPYGGTYNGRVYLFYGRDDFSGAINAESTADTLFDGASNDDYAGDTVGAATDFNDDGYGDLMIAATGADTGTSYSGSVYIVLGPGDVSGSLATVAHAEFYGETYGDQAGIGANATMDVNRDGYSDVLVGAPYVDDTAAFLYDAGATYLIYGPQTGVMPLTEARVRMNGSANYENAGQSSSFIGDQTGDESPEVLIGAPYGSTYSGNAYIVFGDDL